MNLTPMRYKSYTWPHNPRVYSIDFQRAVALHKVPFGRYQLQDLGMGHRVMEGEGEFAGPGAYVEFQKLACIFYEDGPGLLWEDYGLYDGLAVRTGERALTAGAEAPGGQTARHRVVKGDTLWTLAGRYGVTPAELVALNPQIKNPNLIQVGEEVRVR